MRYALFCVEKRVRKQQLPAYLEQGCCQGTFLLCSEDSPWLKTQSAFSTSSANSCDTSKCFNPLELNSRLQRIVLINSLAVPGHKNPSRNYSISFNKGFLKLFVLRI